VTIADPSFLVRPRLARLLALAWFLLSLGGLLLHLRIHPVPESIYHWTPAAFGLLNTFVLPLLFLQPKSVGLAVLAAWFTVIVGSVAMTWHSATTWFGPADPWSVLLKSTAPDIAILWAKLPLAHVILALVRPEGAELRERGCRP